jgi:hypothetical protein
VRRGGKGIPISSSARPLLLLPGRLLVLKKGVFEVALLHICVAYVIIGRGHVRVLGAVHACSDVERLLVLKKGACSDGRGVGCD